VFAEFVIYVFVLFICSIHPIRLSPHAAHEAKWRKSDCKAAIPGGSLIVHLPAPEMASSVFPQPTLHSRRSDNMITSAWFSHHFGVHARPRCK